MPLSPLRYALTRSFIPLVGLCLASCSSESPEQRSPDVVNIGFDGGTLGCAQPSFPADQPDLSVFSPPIFLLLGFAEQSTVGQAQARPGTPIEAEVTVNGPTRRVKVELARTSSPQHVIFADEVETSGNETVPISMTSDSGDRGRYYMRLTLCGLDCDERAVVFDLTPCSDEPDAGPCGDNGTYERTVLEGGEIVQVDVTCVELGTTPGVGSGTIIIQ